jgi:hypothetical protein
MPTATWRIEDVSDLLLLVLRANTSAGRSRLAGITRLQKLVFLVSEDPHYRDLVRLGEAPDLDFEPYKMGPFTPEIYEGVEALASFRPALLAVSDDPASSDVLEAARYAEEVDLDAYTSRARTVQRPTEYRLTQDGKRVADALWHDAPERLRDAITRVVAKYGGLPLRELLRRVYQDHPTMTVRSEIREDLGLA